MSISASQVKELRERTGAGMMECKKALVETDGDVDAAQELLRTRGQASADKKAGRIAAEGRVLVVTDGSSGAIVEVNCETDFVAKDDSFVAFAEGVAAGILSSRPASMEELMAMPVGDGGSVESARRDLIARIGENIGVRRFELLAGEGHLSTYVHGTRIGVVVDVVGGDEELGKDLAMHIAASSPVCITPEDVPADEVEKERRILTEQAEQEGKPPEIVARMVEGRMRKYLDGVTLVGQPFVKDPDTKVGKLLEANGATVAAFRRFEVGEGIEKKTEDFAAEVQAQIDEMASRADDNA